MKKFMNGLKKVAAVTLAAVTLIAGGTIAPGTQSTDNPITLTASADVNTNQILRWGKRGNDVRELQRMLNALGYNCGTIDGIYGSKTYNAVWAFQRDNGLTKDGIAGPNTLRALNNKYNNRNRSAKFNKQRMLNYAKTYWNRRNTAYYYYNNNNCANYCSQCLVAAGMPTNSQFRNGSYAFINVYGLKNYLTMTYKVDYISRPSAGNIDVGDILFTSSGHVMVVTAKSGNNVYASGNTNNRYNLYISRSYYYGVIKTSTLLK